jgi:hypothetical protein
MLPAAAWSSVALATPVDCDSAVEKSVVDQLIVTAETAIAQLDSLALSDAVDRARLLVKCVEVPLSPDEIARLYRVSGISRYVGGDLVNSVTEFAVAKALQPDAPINAELGKPLRMTYDAVPPPTGDLTPLPAPRDGWLQVDGTRADTAPADRGYFLQWVGDDGVVHGTWLVDAGATPLYPTAGRTEGPDDGGGGGGGASVGRLLLVSGIAATVVGLGGIAGAAVTEARFKRSTQPSSELGGLVATNQVLGFGGIGLGVAGAGLIGASFAVGF